MKENKRKSEEASGSVCFAVSSADVCVCVCVHFVLLRLRLLRLNSICSEALGFFQEEKEKQELMP